MHRYSICNQVDDEIFNKQCEALENNIPQLQKKQMLIDIDDSKMQEYQMASKIIKVYNSCYMNEVYIESEIDLLPYFN